MKQKTHTALKEQNALVKHEGKKAQTFNWPLAGNEKGVCLAGDFNGWIPMPMEKINGGFQIIVNLSPGLYQYKFVVDGEWQEDPAAKGNAKNEFGTMNSVRLVN